MSAQTPKTRSHSTLSNKFNQNEYKLYYNNEKRKMAVKYPFLSPQQLHRRVQKSWMQKKYQCKSNSTKQSESTSPSALSPPLPNQFKKEDASPYEFGRSSPASSLCVKIPKYTFINGRKQMFTASRVMHAVAGPGILVTNKNNKGKKKNRRVSFSEDEYEIKKDTMMTADKVKDGVWAGSNGDNMKTLNMGYEKLETGSQSVTNSETDGQCGVNGQTDGQCGVNGQTDGQCGVNGQTDGQCGVNGQTDGHLTSNLQMKDTTNMQITQGHSETTSNSEMYTNDQSIKNKKKAKVLDEDNQCRILPTGGVEIQSKDGIEQVVIDGQNCKPVKRKRGRPRKAVTVDVEVKTGSVVNGEDIGFRNKMSKNMEEKTANEAYKTKNCSTPTKNHASDKMPVDRFTNGDVKEIRKTGEKRSSKNNNNTKCGGEVKTVPKRKRGRPPKQQSLCKVESYRKNKMTNAESPDKEKTNRVAVHAKTTKRKPLKKRKHITSNTPTNPHHKNEGRLVLNETTNTGTSNEVSETLIDEHIPDQKTPRRSCRLLSMFKMQNNEDTIKISERKKLDKENHHDSKSNDTELNLYDTEQNQHDKEQNQHDTEMVTLRERSVLNTDIGSKSQQFEVHKESTVEDADVNCDQAMDLYSDNNINIENRVCTNNRESLLLTKDVDVYDIDSEVNQIELYGSSNKLICDRNSVSTVNGGAAEHDMSWNESELNQADDLETLKEKCMQEYDLESEVNKNEIFGIEVSNIQFKKRISGEHEINNNKGDNISENIQPLIHLNKDDIIDSNIEVDVNAMQLYLGRDNEDMHEYDLESEINRHKIFGNKVNDIQFRKTTSTECKINKKDDISEIEPLIHLNKDDESDSDIEADVNAMQLYLGCDVSCEYNGQDEQIGDDNDKTWDEMSSMSPVQEVMFTASSSRETFQLDSPVCSGSVNLDLTDTLEPLSSSLSSFSDISNVSYHGTSSCSSTKDHDAKENVDPAVESDDEHDSIFLCHGNTSSSLSPMEDEKHDNTEHCVNTENDAGSIDTSQESFSKPVMNSLFKEVSETGHGKQYKNRLVVSNKEEGKSVFQELFNEDNIFF
ncbi:uncharacterized protein LOC144357823 [Saccoglossus kowalevskii]